MQTQPDRQQGAALKQSAARTFRKRRQAHNRVLTRLMIVIIALFALMNLFTKDKDFSDTENRSLQQKPTMSMETLTAGTWASEKLDYYTDQFFSRDGWISLNLRADRLLGLKEENGVLLGKDGYLIGYPEMPAEGEAQAMATAISDFASAHTEYAVRVMVIPSASQILTEQLPKNAPVQDQLAAIDELYSDLSAGVQRIDAATPLSSHADEYIYYKTDHHWTSLGAYYTFSTVAAQLGIDDPITDYNVYPVTTEFEGTLASKVGSHSSQDTITVYEPLGTDVQYYVTNPSDGSRKTSVYDISKLSEKSKYNVFFGDNYPLLEIQTTANNDRVLLVFKDSYANSFVPFLIPYYEKIIMIDPRYYYDSLSACLNSEQITDVLFLFSADTILTDDSTVGVLNSAA